MARTRCGCATGSCSCVVQGGTGVDVDGAGSTQNPYVISLADDFSLAGRFQVQDTDSVELTLNGNGSLAQPFVLTAETSVAFGDLTDVDASNMTPGYVPARQADGTFTMIPAPTAPPGAITTDASLDGDGSAGNPLAVHDYDRIAFLSGADNLPNAGQLRMGDPDAPADSAYWVARRHTGGSGAAAYDVGADHKIGSVVGTSLTPDTQPGSGPIGQPGLQLLARDADDEYTASLRIYRDGRIVRTNTWPGGGGVTVVSSSYLPYRIWSGLVPCTSDGGDSHTGTVTWPGAGFTDADQITITGNTRSAARPGGAYTVQFYNVTNSGCMVRVRRVDGSTTSGDLNVSVQAIQMHPA